jgi:hypothetical protein
MMGVGLLLVAVSISACSLVSSSPGKSLPISVGPGSSKSVHPSQCTLSSSGTQVVASGTFKPPPTIPFDTEGQQVGAQELQLNVVSSKNLRVGQVVVHNPGLGEIGAGVSVGQTSLHLVTSLQRLPGLSPTRCEVTLQYFGGGAIP